MTEDPKWNVLKILPSDYQDYGGEIERWKDVTLGYPDCSCGCKWWVPLHDEQTECADYDWGVCTKPTSPRAGLLTWEHQAGFDCFECNDGNDNE